MKKHRWIKKGICGLLIGLLLTQTVVIAKTEEPEGMKKGEFRELTPEEVASLESPVEK